MLRFLREKGNTWLLKGLLGFVALTFVSWGGYSMSSRQAVPGGRVAAWVNETPITVKEFENRYFQQAELMRRQLGDNFTPELERQLNLRRATFQQVVSEKLQLEEASRLGINIVDGEVAISIQEKPSFQIAGRFDQTRYRQILQQNRLNPRQYEELRRRAVARARLRGYLGLGATVSENEIRSAFRWASERIQVEMLQIDPTEFADEVPVKDDDLGAYFDKNKEAFRAGEKRRSRWWYLPFEAVSGEVTLTEGELKTHYEKTRSRYKENETVAVRQILKKVSPDAGKEALEKAKSEISGIRKEILQGKDFAEMAKADSEGPNASKGGELGTFERGQLLPELDKVVFSLEEGKISEPVQTSFGVHLLKVSRRRAARVAPFEEARKKVESSLRVEKARALVKKKMRLLRYDVEDKKPETEIPGLQKGETSYSEIKTRPVSFPDERGLWPAVFDLKKKSDLSGEKKGDKGVMFFQLLDIKASAVPDFKEVKKAVRKRYVLEKSGEIADRKSNVWLSELQKKERAFEDLAVRLKVKIMKPKAFSRRDAPGEINKNSGFVNGLFRIKKGGFNRSRSQGKMYIIRIAEEPAADMSKYKKEKRELRKNLLEEKRRLIFLQRMDDLRKGAKIRIEGGFSF